MTSTCPRPLEEVIGTEFSGDYRADLGTITGSRSDREIAEFVERLVLTEIGTRSVGALFAEKSVGAVFGLELASGERVVLKLFPRSTPMSELAAQQRCLETLVRSGFPATPPRSRLFRTDDGIPGCLYAFAHGAQRDGHDPAARRELARALAALVRALAQEDTKELPLTPACAVDLWPASHRSYLKLADVPEAGWIDEIGRRARSVLRANQLSLIPVHFDWGVKNARFHGDRVSAIFDWDSLCAACEAEAVGRAAAQFTAQWDFPVPLTPSRVEARAFVEEYEEVRGRRFSAQEWEVVAAGADYLVAQIARLEFAHDPPVQDGYLSLLRSLEGEALVDAYGGYR